MPFTVKSPLPVLKSIGVVPLCMSVPSTVNKPPALVVVPTLIVGLPEIVQLAPLAICKSISVLPVLSILIVTDPSITAFVPVIENVPQEELWVIVPVPPKPSLNVLIPEFAHVAVPELHSNFPLKVVEELAPKLVPILAVTLKIGISDVVEF